MDWYWIVLIAFFSGSIPYSVWLAKIFLRKDVRVFGDGNPGATNVFRAGSRALGFTALMLDVSKAVIPVSWAYLSLSMEDWQMVMIAIAPILGHIFSPFLSFKGGKGLATVLGVWIGFAPKEVALPALLGLGLGMIIFKTPYWSVLVGMIGSIIGILCMARSQLFIFVWLIQMLLIAYTHRSELLRKPDLSNWISRDKSNSDN